MQQENNLILGATLNNTFVGWNIFSPVRVALLGSSGSGKSCLLTNIILQYMQKLRENVIFYALDPKINSLEHLSPRIDKLCIEPADFLPVLTEVQDLMRQRYVSLKELGKSKFDKSDLESFPMIVLIIEEALSVVQNEEVSRDASKKIMQLYTTLFTRARAAHISIIMCSHSFSAECLPTVARDQLNTRIIMQSQSSNNIDMLVSSEEAPAHITLKNPGEFYFITGSGAVPLRAKTWYTSELESRDICNKYIMDKHDINNVWIVKNPGT